MRKVFLHGLQYQWVWPGDSYICIYRSRSFQCSLQERAIPRNVPFAFPGHTCINSSQAVTPSLSCHIWLYQSHHFVLLFQTKPSMTDSTRQDSLLNSQAYMFNSLTKKGGEKSIALSVSEMKKFHFQVMFFNVFLQVMWQVLETRLANLHEPSLTIRW